MKKLISFIFIIIFIVTCILQVAAEKPSVSAQSAIVINSATGGVIAEYNAYKRLPMASTTKIMTALILAEQEDLEKTIITTKEMVTVEGSSMGLLVGDTVSYRALLYGMLLASGNDAANTTAITLAGSVSAFAEMMNDKAAELGLKDTNFVTPSGLDSENHYTTAYDLAILTAYAMKNPAFREAAMSKSAIVSYGNPPYRRSISNHNKMLFSYEGCIGVKTGFTKKSGRCLVSSANRDLKEVIAVTLNAPDDWDDHTALLNHGLSCLEVNNFENPIKDDTISVVGAEVDRVRLAVPYVSLALLPGEEEKITTRIELPSFIYAPVLADEVVGRVVYFLENKVILETNISIAADVHMTPQKTKTILQKVLVKLLLLINKI